MRILLDEQMPLEVAPFFGNAHEVRTVKDMGWFSVKNGELLRQADQSGFDFFITMDKSLRHQQNLAKLTMRFIVLRALDNKIETLAPCFL